MHGDLYYIVRVAPIALVITLAVYFIVDWLYERKNDK